MRVKSYEVFKFDELTEETKEKAIEKLWDINVDYEWWESVFDDAGNIGMEIKGFDIDRGNYCKMEFKDSFENVLDYILKEHGETCETWKTANDFKKQLVKLDSEAEDYEDLMEELRNDFLQEIQEDYRVMLRNEYEYLTSKEAIIETIEANDYEFTKDGRID